MWQNRGGSVTVKFPEFTYEGDLKLKDPLSALGMSEMFDPSAANFSELGFSRGYTNFYCSAINQKTYIEVNRNGTVSTHFAPRDGGGLGRYNHKHQS